MSKRNRRNRTNKESVVETDSVEVNEEISEDTEEVIEEVTEETVEETPVEVKEEVKEEPVKKKHDINSLIEELEGKLPQRALDEWTLRALLDFKDHGIQVELSKRDNYKYSRKRSIKPSEWSVDELMDWMEGNVLGHRSTRDEDIWDEIYLRWKLPSNYTEEAAKAFIIDGVKPEEVSNGILKEDRRRNKASLLDLTYAELCSIYLGEVETTFSKSEVRSRIMKIARVLNDTQFDNLIERFKAGNKNMTTLADQLIGTLEARKELYRKYGDRVEDAKLAVNSKAFYNSLRRAMKADFAEFAEAWRSVLKYVDNNYNQMFNPMQVRRGWHMIELSNVNVAILDRLLTLIVGTRNAATRRKDSRVFKMEYILEYINDERERNNLISFYTE